MNKNFIGELKKNSAGNRFVHTLLSILFSFFLIVLVVPGFVSAASGDDDNAGLGWILFWITLGILIVIVILWIITYFIMRGVIKRLGAESGKLRRYESRKELDEERTDREKDRDRQRRKRVPTGNCLVCNRKFIPGADAYQCDCGKFIHVHCLSEGSLCPHCGREIDRDVGVVRVEDKGRAGTGSDMVTRKKINRLLKAKFCPVCNKIIKAGDSAMQCDCNATFHLKCSDRARKCPKCGS